MSNPNFAIEEVGGQRFVVVMCPVGHRNRGPLVSEQTLTMPLTCAVLSCSRTWKAAVPFMNGLEADEG